MKLLISCLGALLLGATAAVAGLKLERTILLPGVEGRIDHFAQDAVGGRLFVAALGNNSVEVIDLNLGKVVHSIPGLSEPQGLFYLAESDRLYVANGGDGELRVFDGKTFAPIATVKLGEDADNVRFDRGANLLYVGHGSGELSAINPTSGGRVATISLKEHPESFQLEKAGPRAFVNVPGARHIAVVDRKKKAVIATWSLGLAAANFPMALDEAHHRLMIGCRLPARLIVFDTESGREVAKLDLHGDCDDLFLDPSRRRIYASCGEGFIDIFDQADADHYVLRESVKTQSKARTCFLDGDHLYLAAPKHGDRPAEVICYRIEE